MPQADEGLSSPNLRAIGFSPPAVDYRRAEARRSTGTTTPRSRRNAYQPSTYEKMSGATIEASDSITWLGVSTPSLPQVIFSFGTAPEYEP